MQSDWLHILQHSLGCDEYGQTKQRLRIDDDGCFGYYRNRYVSDPTPDLVALCEAGLLKDHGPYEVTGGMHYYRVTKEGLRAMKTHSPKPPVLTRSQRVYREFIDSDCDWTFGEYLKWRWANRHRLKELGYS